MNRINYQIIKLIKMRRFIPTSKQEIKKLIFCFVIREGRKISQETADRSIDSICKYLHILGA